MFKFFLISALLFFLGYGFFSFLARTFGRKPNQRGNHQQRSKNYEPPKAPKKFSKDIGEYVSYEEVKDDDKK